MQKKCKTKLYDNSPLYVTNFNFWKEDTIRDLRRCWEKKFKGTFYSTGTEKSGLTDMPIWSTFINLCDLFRERIVKLLA